MTAYPIPNPFSQWNDVTGLPLTSGNIYIGEPNQDPMTHPIAVYQDAALTIAIAQPIRTTGGFLVGTGTPVNAFPSSTPYSISVRNKQNVQVYYRAEVHDEIGDAVAEIEALLTDAAGAILFSQSSTYTAGTIGRHDQNFVCVTDAPFNAVADGAWSGSVASGTDNYAAFTAALAACAATGKRLYVPAGVYYLAQGITLPAGVEMEGEGYVGLGTFVDSGTRKGTILLTRTTNAASSIKWTENSHGGSLRSMSIFDVHTSGTPAAVINITGVLHPHMMDIEFGSLTHADCPGLLLDSSTTGDEFETLYGNFINCYCTQGATNAGVAYGLKIVGRSVSPSKRANDNHFFGGTFAGYRRALEMIALVNSGGVIGCSFHGVTFEGTWTVDGSSNPYMTVDYVSSAYQILGNSLSATAYSVRVVNITDARQISFHGCYFELGGNPGTYNDGTHGSLTLFPTVWLDNTNYVKAAAFFGCSFNNAYIYDNAVFTTCDTTTDFHRYSAAAATFLKVDSAAAQSVSSGTYTKVAFDFLQGDTYLTWDATNNVANIHSAGVYDCHALVSFTGWAGATQSGVAQIVGGGHTEVGAYAPADGAVVSCECTSRLYLFPGDTVQLNVKQDSGSAKTLSGDRKENRFSIVKIA